MKTTDIFEFKRKIIDVTFYDKRNQIINSIGILAFNEKGFLIYTGRSIGGYVGFSKSFDMLSNVNLEECIPFDKILSISTMLPGLPTDRFNALKRWLLTEFISDSPFSNDPIIIKNEKKDNAGMIYNSYSDKWSYL